MKTMYLPKADNATLFAFVGDPKGLLLIAAGIVFAVFIMLLIRTLRKRR